MRPFKLRKSAMLNWYLFQYDNIFHYMAVDYEHPFELLMFFVSKNKNSNEMKKTTGVIVNTDYVLRFR